MTPTMSEVVHSNQFSDENENPAGGYSHGTGFAIIWQNGPIDPATGPNGATVEAILRAVIDRLEFVQDSGLASAEEEKVIQGILQAVEA